MKKSAKLYLIVLLAFSLLLFSGVIPASGQEINLLANPGFENPYRSVDGRPPRQVADGWNPWHIPATANMPSWQNQQPEYEPAAPDATRIRSGGNAQRYFSYFATHEGGVFQRVTGITPGTELRFSVYAYVWSSTFSDTAISELPGGIIVQVGIDPTGGTDGTSSSVVWSPPAEQYDAYRQYAVIATASSNAVTVFVRSRVTEPIENNNIYLDDAVLAATTTTPPPPTATSEILPTNTPQPIATLVPAATVTSEILPTNTPQPIATLVPAATATPEILPTNTTAPTATAVPDDNATPTREGDTGQPPAATSTPAPTNTQLPPPTSTPSGGTGGPTVPISDEFPNTLVHTVQRGDTVGRLSILYGTTNEAIIQANSLNENALIYVGQGLLIPVRLPAPATSTPTITPEVAEPQDPGTGGAADTIYFVVAGDTLFGIANRYNTTVGALAQLNGIVNPNRIQVGQRLIVPPTGGAVTPPQAPAPTPVPAPVTYVVQPGDNLYRISLRFGVSMQRLGEVNGILNANRIYAGQVLIIP